MKNIPLILLIFFIMSCDLTKDKTEENKEFIRETSDYKLYGFLKNGVLDGPVSEYYPDGSLRALWIAKNGEIHGKTVDYHKSGRLKLFQTYQDGKRNGYKYFFNADGVLQYKILYLNDIETGHAYFFDSKGKPYLYLFSGYSNQFLFKQEIDTITGLQTIHGNILVDDLLLVDTLKDETRVMVANPFGNIKPNVKSILTNNHGPSLKLQLDYINENDEFVYKGNILTIEKIYRPGINASLYIQGKHIKDGFFVDFKNCIHVNEYSPDSVTRAYK